MTNKLHFFAAIAFLTATSISSAVVIYADNFDDDLNTGWTYIDRSASPGPEIGGGPGTPSFSEQNSQLEQTSTNYSYSSSDVTNGVNTLGSLALSGSGSVGGQYSISLDFTSLEDGNNFQDHALVFGYVDEDNFSFVAAIGGDEIEAYDVNGGVRSSLGSASITFSHASTALEITVDTVAGDLSYSYGGSTAASLVTGATFTAGSNGVGSNNDAFAIDNYVVTMIPEPSSVALLGLGGLAMFLRRRR